MTCDACRCGYGCVYVVVCVRVCVCVCVPRLAHTNATVQLSKKNKNTVRQHLDSVMHLPRVILCSGVTGHVTSMLKLAFTCFSSVNTLILCTS
jgi:ABC-type Mn2+/Zn2+ transport system ATPase subunit